MYIERWLETLEQKPDGSLDKRDQGTIQGAVISPLLANLFLHYAFDEWMRRNYQYIPFARFADDIVIHCNTEEQCTKLLHEIKKRLGECKLNLHPGKTKIVYCKDSKRKDNNPNVSFDFLGYTFRPRKCRNKQGKSFTGFNPAVSKSAAKKMRQKIRKWRLQLRNNLSLGKISELYSAVLRGWINYFRKFYASAMYPTLKFFNRKLALWASKKYKNLSTKRAKAWLKKIAERDPNLFPHWQIGILI